MVRREKDVLRNTFCLKSSIQTCCGFSGDENDGYDETLIPVDFTTKGQIVDDDIYVNLVRPMEPGVNVTVLVSCA